MTAPAQPPPAPHHGYRRLALFDMPADIKIGMNLAFYRTFGVPSIAALLAHTGEITNRTRKRADDTGLIIYLLIFYGFDHPTGQEVLDRLIRMHRRHQISNEDYLYVLAALTIVPIRWIEQYGPRPLNAGERDDTFLFYRELGTRMGLSDVPDSLDALEQFFDAFEQRHMRPHPAGRKLMNASRDLLAQRLPRLFRPIAARCADAMLDERLRWALGVPEPGRVARAAVLILLKTQALVRKWRGPARHAAFDPGGPVRSYPDGYTVDVIGPDDL